MRVLGRLLVVRSHARCTRRAASASASAPPARRPAPPADFVLVDALPLLYAAHFAFEGGDRERLRNAEGVDTSIAFSFLRSLLGLLETKPSHLAVVFDPASEDASAPLPADWVAPWRPDSTRLLPLAPLARPARTWRHETFAGYKAQRAPPPSALTAALPLVQELLAALGVPAVQVASVEADDVIATLAALGRRAGLRVAVASPDKDFQQLLAPDLHLLRPGRRRRGEPGGGPEFEPFTEADFTAATEGLVPAQWVDMMALIGDASDNVPGVAGIGGKTAPALLRAHGSLDGVLAAAVAGAVAPPRAAKALAAAGAVEAARLSALLVRVREDVDVPLLRRPVAHWRLQPPSDTGAAREALQRYELVTLLRRFEALWAAPPF